MPADTQTVSTSKPMLITGRIIRWLVIAFMLFDASIKIAQIKPAIEGSVKLGYPAGEVLPLGIVLLGCVVLYAIPRTAVLGAILLTGYFGGATATQVRVQDPWLVFPVFLGVLTWFGLFLGDARIRSLIPLRR